MKKTLFTVTTILLIFIFYPRKQMEYVNVCNWYGMLPKSIITKFESETGIKVRYDIFDNNEVLEAKLMATNSGYDVVFPSASPYVDHQLKAGVYMPLDKKQIPNLKYVDSFFIDQMKGVDPDMKYSVPYVWGTTGLIYNSDVIKPLVDADNLDSLKLLFSPESIQKLAPYGVALLEEVVDVVPMVLRYLKKDALSKTEKSLTEVGQTLFSIRPYIKTFATDRLSYELLTGVVNVSQFWSGDAYKTIQEAKKIGKNLVFFIPKEGASLWIDVMAIPEGAPNPKNAHKFINFMLKPDIAAELSNETFAVTTITESRPAINKQLTNTPFLYPSPEVMKTLHIDVPGSKIYEHERLRLWAKVRQYKGKGN